MFLSEDDKIVATIENEGGRYVKLTIEDKLESIANLIISAGDYYLKFYDKFQDYFLLEYGDGGYFANEERVAAAEKKITEIDEKIREIDSAEIKMKLKVYNFWFADECNDLTTFRRTVLEAGFKIDSSTWLDCVE